MSSAQRYRPHLVRPPVLVTGPDSTLQTLTRYLLRQTGFAVREGSPRPGAEGHPAVIVICPTASDTSGLLALSDLLREDELTGNNAYIFVISGSATPLVRMLQGLRRQRYVAIVQRPVSLDALTRQTALAERWLQLVPAATPISLRQVVVPMRRKHTYDRVPVQRSSHVANGVVCPAS